MLQFKFTNISPFFSWRLRLHLIRFLVQYCTTNKYSLHCLRIFVWIRPHDAISVGSILFSFLSCDGRVYAPTFSTPFLEKIITWISRAIGTDNWQLNGVTRCISDISTTNCALTMMPNLIADILLILEDVANSLPSDGWSS